MRRGQPHLNRCSIGGENREYEADRAIHAPAVHRGASPALRPCGAAPSTRGGIRTLMPRGAIVLKTIVSDQFPPPGLAHKLSRAHRGVPLYPLHLLLSPVCTMILVGTQLGRC